MLSVISDHLGEVRQCYEAPLRSDRSLTGAVMIQADLEQSGRVTRVEMVYNTTLNKPLGECIRQHVVGWTFPRQGTEEGSGFTYFWVFAPTE